jgi:hypothetical protein
VKPSWRGTAIRSSLSSRTGLILAGFSGVPLGNCHGEYSVKCEEIHVVLLSKLGDSLLLFSFNYAIAACIAFYLVTNRVLLRFYLPSIPVIIYFLGQPGKDVFSLLGSLALFTLLTLSRLTPPRCSRYSIFLPFAFKQFSCCSMILLSIYLRPHSLAWYAIFCLLFLSSNQRPGKHLPSFIFNALAAIISLSIAIFALPYLSTVPDFAATNFFGSEFAQSSITAPLVGFSFWQYILRVFFHPIYVLLFPITIITRQVQGFQYFLAVCMLLQIATIFRIAQLNRRPIYLYKFLYNVIVLSALVSIYPFPNLRYFIVFLPSLVCLYKYSSICDSAGASPAVYLAKFTNTTAISFD